MHSDVRQVLPAPLDFLVHSRVIVTQLGRHHVLIGWQAEDQRPSCRRKSVTAPRLKATLVNAGSQMPSASNVCSHSCENCDGAQQMSLRRHIQRAKPQTSPAHSDRFTVHESSDAVFGQTLAMGFKKCRVQKRLIRNSCERSKNHGSQSGTR